MLEPHRIRHLVRGLSGVTTLLADDVGPDRLSSRDAGAVRIPERVALDPLHHVAATPLH
jgi:hypothetical protein